ncbi:dTDP-4-dehydrorhamnose reductase [Photobacterium gaetbulicola]|uniref:dTDP-4-dehydrorhamnose reductase n=1 Tax=Photobacterium gaetbulicola TaxID=1295392 RepID=A0A0B9GY65_9GAMM|nr:dTDP-4-dehydrorhamnose reductase [Photobacterium gaetbulicola]KHT61587.1 dTDP-4-dehydrorhamnose reductase [Photobacterium gaetbulicola]
MLKVLITGSHGQVGSLLIQQLEGKAEVLAVDRDQLDITDESAVFDSVMSFMPDVIINAAAHTAVDRAEEEVELSYKINRDGPMFLAKAAEKFGAAILHISTDYVFSGDKDGSYNEDDLTDPQGIYGKSKLAGEFAVVEACPRHIVLRTAWVFGETGNNFVKTMIRLGRDRDQLGIVGDQYGGPTYAGDIAAALIAIAEKYKAGDDIAWGTYHFSGLPSVSWFEFASYIFDQAHKQGVLAKVPELKSITTADYPTPAKRPANSRLSMRKIEDKFGISACDWKAALQNIRPYGQ